MDHREDPPPTAQQAQAGQQQPPRGGATNATATNNNNTIDRDPQQQQSPQSLSYHQQQLLHLLHLQRAGGLTKITADLAGVHFQEAEGVDAAGARQVAGAGAGAAHAPVAPVALNLPQVSRAHQLQQQRVNKSVRLMQQQREVAAAQHRAKRQQLAAAQKAEQLKQLQRQRQQQQQQQAEQQLQQPVDQINEQQQQQQVERHDSNSGSDSSDHRGQSVDPARDALETAEDAALLKRYKIVQLVGTGNYARVYRAVYAPRNRELAVKSINLSRTTDNYKSKFLPRELGILQRISHPNICKVYEINQVSDRIFIVMQYCSRGTIADLLQRNQGPFTEGQSRYLFAPTVEALVYLHSCDVAHRDVKIENILLDHDYIPKLTDFSFSCLMAEKPQAGTGARAAAGAQAAADLHDKKSHKTVNNEFRLLGVVPAPQTPLTPLARNAIASKLSRRPMRLNETFCGTLPYLSPEMIRQFPYDPRKTDVWSLGVCLYVMLNDRLPFPFNDIKSMVRRQLTRDFKFRSNLEVSDSVKELIGGMLEPNFSKRSTTAELARHAGLSGPRERPGGR